ncbi:MAG: transposase [candidate division Zixibacteria bacterium]|nr:transposase [candidate division Zixibacteria bacterium]
MQNLAQGKGKWKEKISEKRKRTLEMLERIKESDAMKIAVIQELIPLGLKAVQDALQEEVEALAGRRYEHGKENRRWGKQWGSIYLRDQKIPVRVPRVRNKEKGEEVRLQRYQKLQEPYRGDHQTFLKLLNGLSTHRYKESAELVPEVFGLSASSVSRRFTKKAETYLELLEERELGDYDFVAIFIDGKRYAEEGIMIALGITIEGKKIVLGIEQMSTENHRALIQFFDKLIERGLKFV